jgi:phosphocarrier protein
VCRSEEKVTATEATIVNKQGLHARSVMKFVDLAGGFQAEVFVDKGDGTERVEGKNPMQMMLLAAPKGTTLRILTKGKDAEEASQALAALVRDGFGEE